MASEIKIAQTTFTLPASTGNLDVTITDLGWTPKAALFLVSGVETLGTDRSYGYWNIGCTDGTNQWAAGVGLAHNLSTTDNYRRFYTGSCLQVISSASANVLFDATFVSFISNGIRINFNTVDATLLFKVTVVFFGGNDLQAAVGSVVLGNQNVESHVNTLSFQPGLVFFGGCTDASSSSVGSQAQLTFGAATSSANYGHGFRATDNVSTSATIAMVSSNRVGSRVWGSGITYTVEATSFDSEGFSLYPRDGNGLSDEIGYLALYLGDRSVWVGGIDSPTSTGNQSITSPGFTPQWGMIGTNVLAAYDSRDTTGNSGSLGLSSFTSTEEFAFAIASEDNSSTGDNESQGDSASALIDTHTGTRRDEANFVSFDTTGWTLNFTTAGASVRKWWGVAIEEEAAAQARLLALLGVGS